MKKKRRDKWTIKVELWGTPNEKEKKFQFLYFKNPVDHQVMFDLPKFLLKRTKEAIGKQFLPV